MKQFFGTPVISGLFVGLCLIGTMLVQGCGVVNEAVTNTPKNLTLYPVSNPLKKEPVPLMKNFDGADGCLKEVEIHDKPGTICDEVRIGYVDPGARVRTIDCQPKFKACHVQVMEKLNMGWKGYLPFEWIQVQTEE